MKKQTVIIVSLLFSISFAQTESAYDTDNGSTAAKKGMLDPSRFSMQNSLSFGMASGMNSSSNLKSQSLYTTMLQYQFAAPITVNLNFGLPIHSTVSSAQNLTSSNLQSLDYFKSMPLSASLTWQPTANMQFQLNIERNTYSNYFYGNTFPGTNFFRGSIFEQNQSIIEENSTEKKRE